MPILLIVFLVFCLLLIVGLMVRAYLIREKPSFITKLGMMTYCEDGVKVSKAVMDDISKKFVAGMQPLFKDDLADHIDDMTCKWVKEKIQGKYNGMAMNAYKIIVRKSSKDLRKTALAYEMLNACLLKFKGYNVAIDEGGPKRKIYDDCLKQIRW